MKLLTYIFTFLPSIVSGYLHGEYIVVMKEDTQTILENRFQDAHVWNNIIGFKAFKTTLRAHEYAMLENDPSVKYIEKDQTFTIQDCAMECPDTQTDGSWGNHVSLV